MLNVLALFDKEDEIQEQALQEQSQCNEACAAVNDDLDALFDEKFPEFVPYGDYSFFSTSKKSESEVDTNIPEWLKRPAEEDEQSEVSSYQRATNRLWGVVKIIDGIGEAAVAAGVEVGSDGWLTSLAWGVGMHAIDQIVTGAKQTWSGAVENDYTYTAAKEITGSENFASGLDLGLGLSSIGLAGSNFWNSAAHSEWSFFSKEAETNQTLFHNQFPEHDIGAADIIPNNKLRKFNKTWNYVVTEDGKLIVGKKGDFLGGGHIDLAGGKPVAAAGEVKIVKGEIKFIDNSSGHYLPSGNNAKNVAEEAFENQGFDVNGRYVEKSWETDHSLPRGGAWRAIK